MIRVFIKETEDTETVIPTTSSVLASLHNSGACTLLKLPVTSKVRGQNCGRSELLVIWEKTISFSSEGGESMMGAFSLHSTFGKK